MQTSDARDAWHQFLTIAKKKCSPAAFGNWVAPIQLIEATVDGLILEVPNVFVKEYLLSNFGKELRSLLPLDNKGDPVLEFLIAPSKNKSIPKTKTSEKKEEQRTETHGVKTCKLNPYYRFENFIEGAGNQFVKSAAAGIAARPGQSYNPLLIHGGVGLGKTHLLHSIGHAIRESNKKLRVQCITTEAFINELVDHLRNKSIDQLKRFYRSEVDVLLIDDIQFLQNRLNFEEEFCQMFEALINDNKQIVVTSDKPPSQLQLSERMVARMEWGLVAGVGTPDLETRVAILQFKAEQKGLHIPSSIAFSIAEHINHNIRQLEGAINRLTAHSRLFNEDITEQLVEKALGELVQTPPKEKTTVDQILKSVAAVFQVSVSDLKGMTRTKDIALPRQIAMYLAKEMINESLIMIGASFGKTHSTILHACKNIEKRLESDDALRKQIREVRRNLAA